MITPSDTFVNKTALILDVLIDRVVDNTPHNLTTAQIEWFRNHCDIRFRWFHANNRKWRYWLEDRHSRIDPRNQCVVWIHHWFAAYIHDPAWFQLTST